jgi:AcrR family transcriptional regulator
MKDTSRRVLESACRIFAEKGFQNATVAEICSLAGANVASANYYFGTKEHLYEKAIRLAFSASEEEFPLDGGLAPGVPPLERLSAFVSTTLWRTFSDGLAGYAQRIFAHEFSNPIDAMDGVFKDALRPGRNCLRAILRDMLGEDVPESTIRLLYFNVLSLCTFYSFNQKARSRLEKSGRITGVQIDELAEHITRFAEGGIRQSRELTPA